MKYKFFFWIRWMIYKMKRVFVLNYQTMLIIPKNGPTIIIMSKKIGSHAAKNRWFLVLRFLTKCFYNLTVTHICGFYSVWMVIEKVATVSFCTLGKCTYSRLIKNKLYDTLLKGKQVLLKPLWVTKYFIKSRNKKGCQYWKDILSVNAFICAFIHGKIYTYTYPNYKKRNMIV